MRPYAKHVPGLQLSRRILPIAAYPDLEQATNVWAQAAASGLSHKAGYTSLYSDLSTQWSDLVVYTGPGLWRTTPVRWTVTAWS